ncbi:uncharacterized protein TrAFT101_011546 [Trichoderma asperellum]|uniref:uncharacterized protein n=1 Tax=Trichoderma asperellum TaxID=101201 RepID=UPI00332F47F2|nr:hypothetical protein TrAFT101_011546 [Trichoderma asperellum]
MLTSTVFISVNSVKAILIGIILNGIVLIDADFSSIIFIYLVFVISITLWTVKRERESERETLQDFRFNIL